MALFEIIAVERFGWIFAGHFENLDTELRKVVMHWERTGEIAHAFRLNSGHTAHVGAVPVLIPDFVYRLSVSMCPLTPPS